jgi:acyl-CoA synthetase (NDP forming)
MGYYNFDAYCHVSFQPPPDRPPGGITLICHSGSVFVVLADNDPRYRFNLVISPGQENNASVGDYMDFALDQPSTKVIALFIETVRDPAAFIAALEKARMRDVPVVILKVARTEKSARLAATHSGAIAGDDAAYEAVFDRHGVHRARTLDELMASALVLSQPRRPGPGGLAGLLDSGGLRELLIDLAEDEGVPFAALSHETTAKLEASLPYGLAAVNPVDAAGPLTGDFVGIFRECLDHLMSDPDSAVGLFEFEVRDAFIYFPDFIEMAEAMPERHGKPFLVINSFTGARNDAIAQRLLDSGVAMVNGAETALKTVRHMLDHRDFMARAPLTPPSAPDTQVIDKWRRRLAGGATLGESATLSENESLALLADFGIPVATSVVVSDRDAAIAAAEAAGYPVALKTAVPSADHKTELDGVRLNLGDGDSVAKAYDDLAARLGPTVTIQAMAPKGVEIALGVVNDPQFGPLVMAAAGGQLVEVLSDRRFALAPFDAAEAQRHGPPLGPGRRPRRRHRRNRHQPDHRRPGRLSGGGCVGGGDVA